jgi:hypothetical protein
MKTRDRTGVCDRQVGAAIDYVEIEFEQFREALTRQMPDNPTAVTHLLIL